MLQLFRSLIESASRAFLPNRYTVLVIEADEKLREALVELLRSAGFRVDSSATATHGIEILVYRYIDVVVCGMNLPDGEGCELVRSLKSLRCVPRSSHIPAILAAEAKEGATSSALRSGAELSCLRQRALSMLIPQVLFLIQQSPKLKVGKLS